jgi:hypothetical protein
VTHETDLRTAIAYLADLEDELEERGISHAPCANSAARDDMLYQLHHARRIVATLECEAPNISCMSCHNGCDVLVDVHDVCGWCHFLEKKIARMCCDGSSAAAA